METKELVFISACKETIGAQKAIQTQKPFIKEAIKTKELIRFSR